LESNQRPRDYESLGIESEAIQESPPVSH